MKRTIILIFMLCIIGMANRANAQDVKINTNLVVEGDGTMRMDDAATVWDDLRVPLSEPATGTLIPEWAKFPYGSAPSSPYLNWFKASGIDEMYFVVQLPHDWKEGSAIFPHVHWVPSENGTSGTLPKWGLQYAWLNIGETFTSYTTIYGTTTVPADASLIKSRQYLTPLFAGGTNTGISGTDKTISSMLICRIFRDGSATEDTYTGLAGALEVDFHYERNTIGSHSEYTK